MKIAVISTCVFKVPVVGYSGLEHLAWLIAKGLAEKGHEVSIVAPEGSTCPNAKLISAGPEKTWDEKTAFSYYWKELLKQDVIIDHSWTKHTYLLKAEGTIKCPVLGVMHAPVNTMYQSLPPNVEFPCFVCISKDQANHFNALFAPAEARVCYNGIDSSLYKPLNIPRSDRFLFLARFSTIKSPHLALEAAKILGVGLDLVGDTSITNEPDYYNRCKEMCDGKQLRIIGPASRGECVFYFSQAFALLHPTKLFREPFGLAPVEAMACGCPVVGWRYGALPETVLHDRTGFLVRSLDEMVKYMRVLRDMSNGELSNMREVCRKQAEQFSVRRMVDRYEELANEALAGGW